MMGRKKLSREFGIWIYAFRRPRGRFLPQVLPAGIDGAKLFTVLDVGFRRNGFDQIIGGICCHLDDRVTVPGAAGLAK